MTDIVERLRFDVPLTIRDIREAADEIERLRAGKAKLVEFYGEQIDKARSDTLEEAAVMAENYRSPHLAIAIRALKEKP